MHLIFPAFEKIKTSQTFLLSLVPASQYYSGEIFKMYLICPLTRSFSPLLVRIEYILMKMEDLIFHTTDAGCASLKSASRPQEAVETLNSVGCLSTKSQ